MKAQVFDKKSATYRSAEDPQRFVLDRPSVIRLKLNPEQVARYERRGDDLVLVLKDGKEITVEKFFVTDPAQDDAAQNSAHGSDEAANPDAATAEDAPVRSELLLEDENGVLWWGQYPEQWSEFHFTEIEWDEAAAAPIWPWLLGALGVAGGAVALGSGKKKTPQPVAPNDVNSGVEDGGPVSGNVLSNDSTPNGTPLTVTSFTINNQSYTAGDLATVPNVGTIRLNSDGSYVFTPDANYHGTVPTLSYSISDTIGTATGNLVITITPVADLIAGDDANTTAEDTPVEGLLDGNDSTTSGGTLTFTKQTDPANGTVVVREDGSYTYTPNPNFNGEDSFTYTVTDAESGESLTRTVVIEVTPVTDLVAGDDSEETDEDTPVDGLLNGNDSTTSGGTLSFVKQTDPANGTVVVNVDGSYTYTPNLNFNGEDSFTYTVTDADSGESLTREVIITVNPVNDAPVVAEPNQQHIVIEAGQGIAGTPSASGTFTATDVDGDEVTWSVIGTPDTAYGTFAIDADTGEWSYTLADSNSATQALNAGDTEVLTFTVEASDGNGDGIPRTIEITIQGSNDAPVAAADANVVTEAGVAAQSGVANSANTPVEGIASATGNVLRNDTDPDAGETETLIVTGFTSSAGDGILGTLFAGTYGFLSLTANGTYTVDCR